MNILVTGGAGYIGSHTCHELIISGHSVVVVDNLSNSSVISLKRIEKISKRKIIFYKIDLRDKIGLKNVFQNNKIDAVIHFAGLKSVSESVSNPIEYYKNNVISTITLCEVMKLYNCKVLAFSSSATVYGNKNSSPIKESAQISAINPYGQSKIANELFLRDLFDSDMSWSIALLRYFNPVGAHKSGLIGEDPKGIPGNLMPFISQVAIGRLEKLSIFGNDYDTHDGTGVRDYIHVVDLARGHIKVIEFLFKKSQLLALNLGTGVGHSVLDLIKAFQDVSGKKVPYEFVERRSGDIAECYADISLVESTLSWKAQFKLEDMCRDTWKWQLNNPEGYGS
jgi:UDP-glucose 4-epimerase